MEEGRKEEEEERKEGEKEMKGETKEGKKVESLMRVERVSRSEE